MPSHSFKDKEVDNGQREPGFLEVTVVQWPLIIRSTSCSLLRVEVKANKQKQGTRNTDCS